MSDRDHLRRLALVGGLGAVVRVVATLVSTRNASLGAGDGFFYSATANLIGGGHGYVDPLFAELGQSVPTANLPPGWPGFLAVFSALGVDTQLGHRLVGSVLGGAVVIAVGVLATRLGSRRAGLVAACLVALHPGLVTADGSLHAETLFGLLALTAFSFCAQERPPGGQRVAQNGWFAGLGALLGVAALVRGDAMFLAPLLFVAASRGSGRDRSVQIGVAILAMGLVVVPWTLRNAVQLDGFVPVSTNEATLLAGANCDATYDGPLIGSWTFSCLPSAPGRTESERSSALREAGISHATDHLDRLPVVLAARQGRTWGLWQPFDDVPPGRSSGLAAAGTVLWWSVLLPGTVAGLFVLRRRGTPTLLMLAPFVVAAAISVVGYGTPRFRYVPELAAAVLTGVALDGWHPWHGRSRRWNTVRMDGGRRDETEA